MRPTGLWFVLASCSTSAWASPPLPLTDYVAHMKSGAAFEKARKWREAVAEFDAALAAQPGDPHALSEIAYSAFQIGDMSRATKANQDVLTATTDPRLKAASLYNLGRIAEQANDRQMAIADYRQSLALRPNATVQSRLAQLEPPAPVQSSPEDLAFQKIVGAYARSKGGYVSDWFAIDLDGASGAERAAILCGLSSADAANPNGDDEGAVVIERDAAHRWVLRFAVDGRTNRCNQGTNVTRPWFQSSEHAVEIEQGHHGGYDKTFYALRGGVPVVVREESLDDVRVSPRVEVHDYDSLVKQRKATYPRAGVAPLR